jgi:lipid A 3-O-deacylase
LRRLAFIAITLLSCRLALAADMTPLPQPEDATQPPPPQSGRVTVIEENDALAPRPSDHWYTQGFELRYLSAPLQAAPDALLFADFLDPTLPRERRFELSIGQAIFTPANLRAIPPDPRDRPYAGWLYAGVGLYRQNGHASLDHFELDVGVVGPDALAETVQDRFHALLRQPGPSGWPYQLKNEPGLVFSYEHKWRFGVPLGAGLSIDAVPELGTSLGNVYTYGEAGTLLRLGNNLKADYGPARIRPALSSGWFDPAALESAWGWYLFVGAQARAVARDIFLDGNTFASSPRVQKRPIVGDLSGGASLFCADLAKIDLVLVWRSREFVGQSVPERYGGINISFRLL